MSIVSRHFRAAARPRFSIYKLRSTVSLKWSAIVACRLQAGYRKAGAVSRAKAKAEDGYRFYALYDKISREDMLAHAYAQCRSHSEHVASAAPQ